MGHYDKKFLLIKQRYPKKRYPKKRYSKKRVVFGKLRLLIWQKKFTIKRNPLKSIKIFFPKNFKEGTTKEQKAVLLDAVKLMMAEVKS